MAPSSSSDSSIKPRGKNSSLSFHIAIVNFFQVRPSCFVSDVCIVGVSRTPMGGFLGSLSSLSATRLGSIAIQCNNSYSLCLLFVCLFVMDE